MRQLAVITVLPAVLLAAAACTTPGAAEGEEGARDAAASFLEAVRAEDGDTACKLLTNAARQDRAVDSGEGDCTVALAGIAGDMSDGEMREFEAVQVDRVVLSDNGPRAEVVLSSPGAEDDLLSGIGLTDRIELKRTQDRWAVESFSFRQAPNR
ncbi:hypothetical protein IQ251_08590 [Saccharopolyspora sp. HNM0983]|uniref:DUF4878 domain-containing protein n=1 Tax=Saccharopolyspora montiporae TaxID=2781240 RepID=A0A929B776_9PSEU|nr:hypothetical protein [Saccharopolyspora sp. HNM0983]MBE9374504.1 hypothetical protein [Saccharopolyspora sp. HNM0983]